MESLSATIDIAGIDEASQATTELGKAVSDMEPVAEKVGKTLDLLATAMSRFIDRTEEDAAKAEEQAAQEETRRAKAESAKEKRQQESEEQRLKQSMARIIGGGVNTIAYQQQLSKLEEQQKMIQQAEERRLISHRDASAAIRKLKLEHAKLNIEAKAYTAAGGGMLGSLAARVANKTMQVPGQAWGAVKNRVAGIGTGVMGLMSSLPIAGGLFGLLMYGITNRDRINAETGEIINIAVAASGKLSSAGAGFLGSFQQQAEHYFGINRQEVQSVLKTFVDAGHGIDDILKKQSGTLGLVGHDIMTLTLGIDKHFELASGTSARNVVSLTHDFGMSLKDAGDMYTKLAFAGSRSGMGTQNFVNAVMQGASALRMYGVSVENVAGVLMKLQERYESMGMPKQLAGQQASMSLQQITQGMSGMSSSMQAYFGERMGLGTGLEARMKFREGMERVGSGKGDNQFFSDFVGQAYKSAMESTGGDKTAARYALEQQGFGFEGAKGIVEIGGKMAQGVKLNELSLKEQQALRDAFKTEGQKQSEIAKNTHTIMQGLAGVGEGILQVVTNIIAYSILFYKSLPTLLMGSDEEKKAVWGMADQFFKAAGEGFDKMLAGSKTGLVGLQGLLGPILDPMIRAVRWNPSVDKQMTDIHRWNYEQARKKAADDIASTAPLRALGTVANRMQTDPGSSGFTRGLGSVLEGTKEVLGGLSRAVVYGADYVAAGNILDNSTARYQRELEGSGRYGDFSTGGTAPPKPPAGKTTTTTVTVNVRPAHKPRPSTVSPRQ